jgi:Family of unknown function (DUF5682)
MSVHLFGIRHHGPGCARSLRAALDELQPDAIVMEGPADAQDALALAAHCTMTPPVALLIYPPEDPRQAVYFPMTDFSPEWQTLRWAAERTVPVTLMDLPQSHQFAIIQAAIQEQSQAKEQLLPDTAADQQQSDKSSESVPDALADKVTDVDATWRTDPLALLAEAAGYRDHELWWEEQIERRTDATNLFAAIREAMHIVREEVDQTRERDLLREAFMRRTLRNVLKQGHDSVAVVCGAWHAPVLDEDALAGRREGLRATDDNARLKGLPKVKTATTWIPWTHSRLSYRSGYGAGVESPGWYSQLWTSRDEAPTRWIATAARLLREKDLDASSAGVIEAVRLADALAAVRNLRSPGLAELNEAIQAVLCHGEAAPMQLIRRRLEIGDVLGAVPEETPAVPLARNLSQLQKSLRLKPSTESRLIDLDLRKEIDLARSHLLHQLNLLGIHWGDVERTGGRTSTFHEVWRLEWQPEFAVAIIEANVWGNSVEGAATARVIHDSGETAELSRITELLDRTMLAGLNESVDPILARIQALSAVGTDVRHLMDALPPLARIARYSDVRGTRADHVVPILVGLFERAVVGIVAACSSLDDEAAERMLKSVGRVSEALDMISRDDLHDEWRMCLRRLISTSIHPLLRGWSCRLLLEQRILTDEELERLAYLALSTANPPAESAAWASGLLRGSGLLLLHQESVWHVFNRWMCSLSSETFIEMLPLLRRAFSNFTGPERRQMAEKVRHLQTRRGSRLPAATGTSTGRDIDLARGRKVLPVLAHILGVEYRDGNHR